VGAYQALPSSPSQYGPSARPVIICGTYSQLSEGKLTQTAGKQRGRPLTHSGLIGKVAVLQSKVFIDLRQESDISTVLH
jgi:hypothetical protein